MFLHRLALGAAGAALALALGATAALAASAYASTTVNVRAGAGTGYPVVDVLRAGQRIDVDYCRGSWCMVSKPGPDGWVSASYLSRDRYDDGEDYYDDYDDYGDEGDFFIERPRYRPFYPFYRSQVCWGGKNTSLCFSD